MFYTSLKLPRGLSLFDDNKNKIVKKINSGEKQASIGRQLNLNRSVISKIISLWKIRKTVKSPPKTDRPRKTTSAEDRKIKRFVTNNPFASASVVKQEFPDVSLSIRSIRYRLSEMGLYGPRPAKKPYPQEQSCQNPVC